MSVTFLSRFTKFRPSPELVLGMGAVATLAALVVPLPAPVLDGMLAVNLAIAVALLVSALNATHVLNLGTFPTLLLLTTLLRLALNVSSTRLALAEGHAGRVIQAFGEFVVRGDFVVGAVVFAILTLVQFLVVAKGAERVAEVSARFTLDAMPGKQMAIDADLRAGTIDQAEASKRRRTLEAESQMFGAMDGAMKFVKGDVLAGLIIVAVNLLGGTAVGVLSNGLSFSEAAETYALIAIGDGLVSQVPSLCVAIAAALLVTRVQSVDEGRPTLAVQLKQQLLGDGRSLWAVAVSSGVLACLPEMPALPFVLVALAAGGAAWGTARRTKAEETAAPKAGAPTVPEAASQAAGGLCRLALELAPDLSALALEENGKFARDDLAAVRQRVLDVLGVPVPPIHVRLNASHLPPGGYVFLLDELPTAGGTLSVDARYALSAPDELAVLGVQAVAATEPGTGQPMCRVRTGDADRLALAGISVRTPSQLLCEHLVRALSPQVDALLGIQEVSVLLEGLEPTAPVLVKEALGKVPLPLLTEVFRRLVREGLSIRNLRCLLEALVSPSASGDARALAERCRQGLSRELTKRFAPSGKLFAYLVDPEVEEALRTTVNEAPALSPGFVAQLLEAIGRIAPRGQAVLLAAPDVRPSLRRLCEGAFPDVAVLTYGELDPALQIRPLGRLSPAAQG